MKAAASSQEEASFRQILGLRFFVGTAREAIARVRSGGLVTVPAAPGLKNLPYDAGYRDALLGSDLLITDSSFMVLIWNFLERDSIRRVSGLEYLSELLKEPDIQEPHNTFWVMAGPDSARRNAEWLANQGIQVTPEDQYIAPVYGKIIEDRPLVEILRQRKPRHVILTVGGGTQEKVGLYLKQNLDYLPAIHCIGAAIAFLSGDQVKIPHWADRMYLGWLLRCIWRPQNYVPRYWAARKLLGLMLRYRARLPMAQV